jgi:hypothetical protein
MLAHPAEEEIMDQPAATFATQPIALEHAIHGAGGVAAWTRATAEHHGLLAQTEPVDTFADAVSRLSEAEVDLDPTERLLLAIERAGIVDGRQDVLLHAAYLRPKR